MQLSVVILNYNVRYFLELCLASVEKAIKDIDAEIIVVDNNSPDDSCDMVRRLFPNARLIQNTENSGFPKGNNIGVAGAKGEYICILNPDTVVAEDTFAKILEFAEAQSDLGIAGCRLIDGSGKFLPESKRGIPTPFTAFTKITGLYKLVPRLFGKYYAMHVGQKKTAKVDILVGAFMFMKRKTYVDVGGFDENCFMYADDIDLSYRVLKTGKSNYYYAGTTVVHYKGESTVRDGLYVERFREAMNFFYKKHFRVSMAFDRFMRLGVLLFAHRKRKQLSTTKIKPQHFLLVSTAMPLKERLSKLLEKSVTLVSETDQKKLNSLVADSTQIIFDSSRIDFKTIIDLMDFIKAKVTFRMAHGNIIIGSDSSNGRGEVQILGKE